MFMTDVNDVKIYNLSAGKSLPDWLTDQKRRKLLNQNVDLRKRIELIQEFDMPDSSHTIRMSPDHQFIIAAGTYKPRVKCFEVSNLSLKFERCFDSEVVAVEVLSDDYSKMVFLQCDRYIEFHAAHGRHYRLRIPRFGYDMRYHKPTCDLFVVGASSEIYRLNLERGKFMQPLQTDSKSSVNRCDVNPEHHLLCVGTQEGIVEAWDPRDRQRVGILDVAINIKDYKVFPAVSAMKFKNGLHLGVGTQSGQILLFDIRARQPLLVKDHLNKLPIRRIDYNVAQNAVYSLDAAIFKIWNENDGKQIAYVESESSFNDFCTIPESGMLFFAQEDMKMLTYYVPTMGHAPRWCSFLDNLTEEIESENLHNIYDDYKFVTKQELSELGLDHLEGTNLLRAYMHGFFIDIRLYNKARAVIDPFAFEKYRKEKIRHQIEANRPSRLQIKSNLPAINQELALKLMDAQSNKKSSKSNLLEDNRFKAMFENADFQVDKEADEYKMLAPALTRLDKSKLKELKRRANSAVVFSQADEEERKSSDDDLFSEADDADDGSASSDDEDRTWIKGLKKQYRQVQKKNKREQREEGGEDDDDDVNVRSPVEQKNGIPTMLPNEYEVKSHTSRINRTSLGQRVAANIESSEPKIGRVGNLQMHFSTAPKAKIFKQKEKDLKQHREERKGLIRPIKSLRLKKYVSKQ